MNKKILAAAIIFTFISGCAGEYNRAQSGAAIGAASGAVIGQTIGRNTGGTLIGVAVGTMLGYIIGNEMDKVDQQKLNAVYETGVSGQPSSWVNPDTGNNYTVTPQAAVMRDNGQPCRKAEVLAVIDGKTERAVTTACRDGSGQWVLQ
ncbi:MAG: glycine zipper 2TM domain-containing protein [Desulfobulbaceae bacterium]|jgi:surface antigen|nr:glycine zipper 2TM domain-containing protein [Desulfobulbaceae bacterium]